MIRAFFFDFNQTLIKSPAWMELELRAFPRAALASLADQNLIEAPSQSALDHADSLFRARRRAANRSGRESTHLQDLQALLRSLGFLDRIPSEALDSTIASLHRGCLHDAQLVPGAAEALPALKRSGYRLGIVSNAAFSPFVNWSLEKFDLVALFDQVVISADVGLRKPRRAIFELALVRMGMQASETVHVGDDFAKDIRPAKRAGLSAVWLNPDGQPMALDRGPDPDAIFPSLQPLPDWAASQALR